MNAGIDCRMRRSAKHDLSGRDPRLARGLCVHRAGGKARKTTNLPSLKFHVDSLREDASGTN